MINVKKYFKENEFQSLSYVIIAWMVMDMLSYILLLVDVEIYFLTLSLGVGCVGLYGKMTASLKNRFKGFAVLDNLCVIPILSDLIFGTGMERVVQSVSRRLKRAWMIWKCAGVILGIFLLVQLQWCLLVKYMILMIIFVIIMNSLNFVRNNQFVLYGFGGRSGNWGHLCQ